MREFFLGWRRRIGVATLVLACVFLAGWVRSFVVNDQISIRRSTSTTHHIASNRSRLFWYAFVQDQHNVTRVISLYQSQPASDKFFGSDNWKWHWTIFGFH